MSSLCRLCSCRSSSLTEIYSCMESGRLILDMITVICPVRIFLDDNLPQSICDECLETLISAMKLREKSVQSDRNFRSQSRSDRSTVQNSIFIKEESFEGANVKQEFVNIEENDFMSDDDSWDLSPLPIDDFQTDEVSRHRKSRKRSACPYDCGQTFAFKNSMKRHVRRAHGDDEAQLLESKQSRSPKERSARIKCPYECGMTFAFSANIKRHVARFHEGKHLITSCPHCSYRFINNHKLNNHLKNFHSSVRVSNGLISCDICGVKIFASGLTHHKRIVHSENNEGSLACDSCGKIFSQKTSLEFHMEKFHLKDNLATSESFKCTVGDCEKTFKSKYSLMYHMENHESGEPRFSCEICSRRFVYQSSVFKHMRRVHYNSLQFSCEICSTRFRTEKQLMKHFKNHEDAF